MKGVLLIAPLNDVSISKSTAAERRLLDFSGGLFFHVGYLFCTDWGKKICSVSPERTDSFWPNKVSFFAILKHVQFAEKIGTLQNPARIPAESGQNPEPVILNFAC